SLEMFRNTYQLAAHRGLLDPDSPDVAARRLAFRDEIDAYRLRMDAIAERMRIKEARVLGEAIPAAL
ncbi:MAG TPA: hypothetical protein VES02_06140, partial [Dermatophilaceae bacterium]|nr:hypothetical protein [Dermatophilaceae bacterium]